MIQRKLLIPIDGSVECQEILSVIYSLFQDAPLEITLMQVVYTPFKIGHTMLHKSSKKVERSLDALARQLESFGYATKVKLEYSDNPARAIVFQAVRANVDAIAMTTHGETAMKRLLVGSVAEEVLRNAPVPVLMVRPTLQAQSRSQKAHYAPRQQPMTAQPVLTLAA